VSRKRFADELSVDELRQLLIEKRRSARQDRLDQYRRTGRVILVNPEPPPANLETLRTAEPVGAGAGETVGEPRKVTRRKRIFDRLLLFVEIVAVIGLIAVFLNGFNVLQGLNKEVASALTLPTLTPTPLISAVVLPSGHTPPNPGTETRFNDAEIPEHLRPLVQTLANIPAPTSSPESAVEIQIAAIGLDAPIVQGDGWEQLKKGVGQHIGSPNPGQTGNLVLSAHNDVFGQLFRDLDKLKVGDQIIIFTQQKQYIYRVINFSIVLPTQVEVMAQTDRPDVTLISCYPYLVDKKRIVVSAELQR
jgi:sortase A